MNAEVTEEQLLFAVKVIQEGYATPDQVAKASATCLASRTRTLGEQLESDGVVSAKQRILIERQVRKALADQCATLAEPLSSEGPLDMGSEDEGIGKITSEQPGHYTVKGVHGRGGQARVLRAFDEHIGRDVALKEMVPDRIPDQWGTPQYSGPQSVPGVVRFLREARVTGQLEHPNIVPVYEVGRRDDGALYYTMRLVRGKTMARKLAECQTLADRMKLLGAYWDLCNAIAYAHSRGVVHRDIKPSNVMVGEFGETVLLDWGIAKVKGRRDIGARELERDLTLLQEDLGKTSAGAAIGTPSYMSPEQARGDIEEIDERSDIWGLGAVLYEILTGRPPYTGKTRQEIVLKVGRKPVAPVLETVPDASPELAAIAHKALRRDKKNRYQTAGGLAEDMNAFMTGGRVRAYEYSAWELLRRFASQHKAAIAAAGLILLVIIGALIFVSFSYRAERTARENEAIARRKEAAARAQEHEERLVANYHLAQAYTDKAELLMKDKRFLSAKLLAAASLEHNPSHPKSSFFSAEFLEAFPRSHELRVKAASQIYRAGFQMGARLQQSFMTGEALTRTAFSPDGTRLAAGSYDGSVRIWNLETGALIHTLQGHTDRVFNVAFSPDGRLLASAGDDKRVILWEVQAGKSRTRLHDHAGAVHSVSFSPEGTWLGSASWDGTARIRDARTGKLHLVLRGHTDKVNDLAFSPRGQLVATAGEDRTVRLWSLPRGKQLEAFNLQDEPVYAVAFSPDGRQLAAAGNDRRIHIWDLASRTVIRVLEGHTDGITRLCYAPDGSKLASSSYDRTVRIWNRRDGRLLLTIDGHQAFVLGVSFDPSGKRLASASYDKSAKIWKLDAGRGLDVLRGHEGTVYGIAFSRDGKLIASGGWDRTVRLWQVARGRTLFVLRGHQDVVDDLAISRDATMLASGSRDKTVRMWDLKRRKALFVLRGHQDEVFGVDFSPDQELLASCGADKTIRVWDTQTGKPVVTLEGHTDQVDKVAFSPDSRWLASAGYDKTVRIWEPRTDQQVRVMFGHNDWISGVDYSADGTRLGSAGKDRLAIIWNASSGQELMRLRGHDQWVNSIRFSPDGKLVATASDDRTVRLWSSENGRQLLKIPASSEVVAIAFSPDAKVLAVGDGSEVKLYPMDFSSLDTDPRGLLEEARRASGMRLDGFQLVVESSRAEVRTGSR